jgi:thiol-disulfide isomerase/thioredoxin
MKKTLLLGLFLLAGFSASAQLADGSTAPDFTATDINGNTHTLSEYLAQGKTVIIDISATWCGPCWNYHGTRALSDVYEAFGEGGSDQVVVLFIEGDPGTSLQSIYGTNTSSDTSVTRGDWTNHSPYPIIDDATGAISNAYQIEYFPTVYMICPEGIVTELTQPTAAALRTKINNTCMPSGTTLTGVSDKVRPDVASAVYCEADGAYSAKIKNLGSNRLTNATVVLKENGNVLSTKTYTNNGGLAQFGTATINFDSATFTAGADHTVEVTSVNNLTQLPHPDVAIEHASIISNNAVPMANNLTVKIHTDFYPGEASWEIRRNDTNTLVASGGGYQQLTNAQGQAIGGGPDANTIKTQQVLLPDGVECYKVILKDSYGDGWTYGPNNTYLPSEFHGIRIYNAEELVFERSVSTFSFGTYTLNAALISNGTLGTAEPSVKEALTVYPNPSTGIINISATEDVDVSITDMTGKIVFRANGIANGGSLNLNSLQKGMYIATLKGATGEKSEKIVIN